ncbi:MAG: helix-turn-helix domain-containing protein, partial [Clostridium sp.]
MNNLPDILKYLREDSDFKQHELASKLNVARTTIASYESGKA